MIFHIPVLDEKCEYFSAIFLWEKFGSSEKSRFLLKRTRVEVTFLDLINFVSCSFDFTEAYFFMVSKRDLELKLSVAAGNL